jgi:hypothetical protein
LIPLYDRFKNALQNSKYLRFKQNIKYSKKYVDRDNYALKNRNSVNHFVDILRVDIENLILDTNTICNINL